MNNKNSTLISKNILITGATSGIGLQLAKDYSKSGWQVFGCGRNFQALDKLTAVIPLQFDVTDRLQVYQAAASIIAMKPEIHFDLVILNAGDCKYINDPIHFDDQIFEQVIKTNLLSIGYCLGAFSPLVKQGGRIGLMGSSASFLPLPRAEAYGASKAAIAYLADSLRIDLASKKIHISTIFPGFVNTPLTEKNTFPMPACIDVDKASFIIQKQLAQGQANIHFPKRLTLMMKLFALLPTKLWQKIASSLLIRQH